MATAPSLEERLAAVEAAVAELRERIPGPERPIAPDWLDRIIGSFKDEPAFDEVIRYGCEFREADRPVDINEP